MPFYIFRVGFILVTVGVGGFILDAIQYVKEGVTEWIPYWFCWLSILLGAPFVLWRIIQKVQGKSVYQKK